MESLGFSWRLAPGEEDDTLVRDSLCAARVSERLRELLRSSASVQEALSQYKVGVVTELADVIRAQEARSQLDDVQDDELLLRLLPEPNTPLSDLEIPDVIPASSRKRGFADISMNPVQAT